VADPNFKPRLPDSGAFYLNHNFSSGQSWRSDFSVYLSWGWGMTLEFGKFERLCYSGKSNTDSFIHSATI
jgi:hypothetical protein